METLSELKNIFIVSQIFILLKSIKYLSYFSQNIHNAHEFCRSFRTLLQKIFRIPIKHLEYLWDI